MITKFLKIFFSVSVVFFCAQVSYAKVHVGDEGVTWLESVGKRESFEIRGVGIAPLAGDNSTCLINMFIDSGGGDGTIIKNYEPSFTYYDKNNQSRVVHPYVDDSDISYSDSCEEGVLSSEQLCKVTVEAAIGNEGLLDFYKTFAIEIIAEKDGNLVKANHSIERPEIKISVEGDKLIVRNVSSKQIIIKQIFSENQHISLYLSDEGIKLESNEEVSFLLEQNSKECKEKRCYDSISIVYEIEGIVKTLRSKGGFFVDYTGGKIGYLKDHLWNDSKSYFIGVGGGVAVVAAAIKCLKSSGKEAKPSSKPETSDSGTAVTPEKNEGMKTPKRKRQEDNGKDNHEVTTEDNNDDDNDDNDDNDGFRPEGDGCGGVIVSKKPPIDNNDRERQPDALTRELNARKNALTKRMIDFDATTQQERFNNRITQAQTDDERNKLMQKKRELRAAKNKLEEEKKNLEIEKNRVLQEKRFVKERNISLKKKKKMHMKKEVELLEKKLKLVEDRRNKKTRGGAKWDLSELYSPSPRANTVDEENSCAIIQPPVERELFDESEGEGGEMTEVNTSLIGGEEESSRDGSGNVPPPQHVGDRIMRAVGSITYNIASGFLGNVASSFANIFGFSSNGNVDSDDVGSGREDDESSDDEEESNVNATNEDQDNENEEVVTNQEESNENSTTSPVTPSQQRQLADPFNSPNNYYVGGGPTTM